MVQSQYSISWDTYKTNICSGFSALQQNGELVDMTLAADGHMVKVHQVLMALVSPYLKDLITSTKCQHPVIFMNDVSFTTLSALLEYIYTGEVLVPSDNLHSFVKAARNLHIKGLENLENPDNAAYQVADTSSPFIENIGVSNVSGIKKLGLHSDSGLAQYDMPAGARKIIIRRDDSLRSHTRNTSTLQEPVAVKQDFISQQDVNSSQQDISSQNYEMLEDSIVQDSDEDMPAVPVKGQTTTDPKDAATSIQYTVSIRGSLQIILNRYIYNIFSTKVNNGVRRWRCVDYRNNRCKAFVVTKGNVVLNRANLHNHPFHDKKILQKIEKQSVFSAIDEVESYKEKMDTRDEEILP